MKVKSVSEKSTRSHGWLVRAKCEGTPFQDKCEGRWKDPSGDGHGGLNGGAWVTCSVCGGYGIRDFWVWSKEEADKYRAMIND
jgi:hypothetical protein